MSRPFFAPPEVARKAASVWQRCSCADGAFVQSGGKMYQLKNK